MRNKILIAIGSVLLLTLNTTAVMAGSSSWSYSNYNHGSYVPKSGSFIEAILSGDYSCRTSFRLDSHNVSNIEDYNDGGENPGTACDNAKAYLTLDQSAEPDSWDLEIDARSVITNLPNPKIDIEDNNWFGENDESEVAVLGQVQVNKWYYMRTYWDDYRDGDAGDSGDIQAQFAMSKKGFSDYNNCTQSDVVQIINAYGDDLGDL